jgi:Beta-lactamase superfamily domain
LSLPSCRFVLLGVGAMNSPRYAPAGLLIEHGGSRVAIDGGPGAEPSGNLDAWLVTDKQAELIGPIRRLARVHGVEPKVDSFTGTGISITPQPVVHTSHPTVGYLVVADGKRVGWAPEFLKFPAWTSGVDLLFAEAAGWSRPIRFAHGTGGHAPVQEVARLALDHQVKRLVFAHIGRPTIAAIDSGRVPPFGEMGADGSVYLLDSL